MLKESVDDRLDEAAGEELAVQLNDHVEVNICFCTCMIWRASHAVQFTWVMCLSTLPCFLPFSFSAIFFSRLEHVASWLAGGNVRVSGFEAGLAVFICAHRVVLGSSVLVRTAGRLSPSPSLVLAETLHVGFFFFYFSSLAIHSASFVSSGFLVMTWQVEVVVV